MRKKVEICGIDTATLPKLTNEQSKKILTQIKGGDNTQRDYFVTANLRLVLSVVHRYSKRENASMEDLFQVGCVGLIKAINNFDVSLNVRFSTYAVPMIVGEVRRFLREGSLRVSRSIRDVAYQALQARERLQVDSVSEVTVQQIANELDMPVSRVSYCLDAVSAPVSLCEKVFANDDDTFTLLDQLADSKVSEAIWVDKVTLSEALKRLTSREQDVIAKRYFQGKTQMEISNEIGISQAQVSRIEKGALSQIRTNFVG
jgi:RNA polymerase sporulation-specific sigma factor